MQKIPRRRSIPSAPAPVPGWASPTQPALLNPLSVLSSLPALAPVPPFPEAARVCPLALVPRHCPMALVASLVPLAPSCPPTGPSVLMRLSPLTPPVGSALQAPPPEPSFSLPMTLLPQLARLSLLALLPPVPALSPPTLLSTRPTGTGERTFGAGPLMFPACCSGCYAAAADESGQGKLSERGAGRLQAFLEASGHAIYAGGGQSAAWAQHEGDEN